ncbi:MAG: DUF2721 domain-containing protein [Pyrinomonadaceae bacterium]
MEALSPTLAILTAMITPALLISASGALVLSTSARLGRTVDRVRMLADELETLVSQKPDVAMYDARLAAVFKQLDKVTTRSRLLQRAMVSFYRGVAAFILTSIAIGVVAIIGGRYSWIPVGVGIIGVTLLFYGSVLLMREAHLARVTINLEMDFIWRLARHLAPQELVDKYTKKVETE